MVRTDPAPLVLSENDFSIVRVTRTDFIKGIDDSTDDKAGDEPNTKRDEEEEVGGYFGFW